MTERSLTSYLKALRWGFSTSRSILIFRTLHVQAVGRSQGFLEFLIQSMQELLKEGEPSDFFGAYSAMCFCNISTCSSLKLTVTSEVRVANGLCARWFLHLWPA